MAEHKHGEMDVTAHHKAFEGFVTFLIRAVTIIFVALVLLALINA